MSNYIVRDLLLEDGDLTYTVGTEQLPTNVIVITWPLLAASVDSHIFIADRAYQVLGAEEIHTVVGGASAAVALMRTTGTEAPASGDDVLTADFDLTSTVNTVVAGTLSATAANTVLADGDRLSLDFSGTLTGLVGAITVYLRPTTS